MLLRMLHDTKSHSLAGFLAERLQPGLSRRRAGDLQDGQALARTRGRATSTARPPRRSTRRSRSTKIMAPPTNCISPIGEKAILHGLYKQIKGEFYTAVTRPPAVYRGNPFVIEAGLAFGKGPEQAAPATGGARGPARRRRGSTTTTTSWRASSATPTACRCSTSSRPARRSRPCSRPLGATTASPSPAARCPPGPW